MPTGYTAELYNGDEISFEEFVWNCARGFGALVHMREDPKHAPIQFEDPPSSYYADRIAALGAQISEAESWSAEEAEAAALEAYTKEVAAHEARTQKVARLRERYEAMRAQVAAWTPPTPDHEGLRDFMLNQIQTSAEVDCVVGPRPTQRPGPAFREESLENLQSELANARKAQADEQRRAQERKAWLEALHASVPLPAKLRSP